MSLALQGDGTAAPARPRFTPQAGMAMLGLSQVQLFWERSLDTKVLIGWSDDTVVISFRGTASLRNALADLQARSLSRRALLTELHVKSCLPPTGAIQNLPGCPASK